MIVYNEQELLRYSLPQALEGADQLIIINGSPFGPSSDKTKEAIEPHMDKIIYREGKYGELFQYNNSFNTVMRNEYLKLATGDFILVLDADEFWSFEDVEKMKEAINDPKNADITGIDTNNLHFYIDVFHMLRGVGVGQHHRITKNIPGAAYSRIKPNSVLYLNDKKPVATSGRFLRRMDITCFHVGHALPWEEYKKKQSKFFYKGYPGPCWNVKSIEELNALKEQRDPKHEKIAPYNGPYPEFMQKAISDEHSFFIRRL